MVAVNGMVAAQAAIRALIAVATPSERRLTKVILTHSMGTTQTQAMEAADQRIICHPSHSLSWRAPHAFPRTVAQPAAAPIVEPVRINHLAAATSDLSRRQLTQRDPQAQVQCTTERGREHRGVPIHWDCTEPRSSVGATAADQPSAVL